MDGQQSTHLWGKNPIFPGNPLLLRLLQNGVIPLTQTQSSTYSQNRLEWRCEVANTILSRFC